MKLTNIISFQAASLDIRELDKKVIEAIECRYDQLGNRKITFTTEEEFSPVSASETFKSMGRLRKKVLNIMSENDDEWDVINEYPIGAEETPLTIHDKLAILALLEKRVYNKFGSTKILS